MADAVTALTETERRRLLRQQLVSALQRAGALAHEIDETDLSRHLAKLADLQYSQLPQAPADERFEHADERRG